MSTPDVNPAPEPAAAPVLSAPPGFEDVAQTVQADSKEAVAGAVAYLATAAEAAKSKEEVIVDEATADAEKLAFQVAEEHGFSSYLALFKSSIEAGRVKIVAGISDQVHALLDKGIAALKALIPQ